MIVMMRMIIDDYDDFDDLVDLVNFLLWAMAATNVLWPIAQPLTPQGKEQDSLWIFNSVTSSILILHILQKTGPLCWLDRCRFNCVMSVKGLAQNRQIQQMIFSVLRLRLVLSWSVTIFVLKTPPPSVRQSGQRPLSDSKKDRPITLSSLCALELLLPNVIFLNMSLFSWLSDLLRNRRQLELKDKVFAFEWFVQSVKLVVELSQTWIYNIVSKLNGSSYAGQFIIFN